MVNGISSTSSTTSTSSDMKSKMESELKAAGVPSSVIAQGAEAVKSYCEENNISLPEPPAKPEDSTSIFSNSSTSGSEDEAPAELQTQLLALGVPAATIAEGREAVMSYCEENNITLPTPPNNGNSSASTSGSLDYDA